METDVDRFRPPHDSSTEWKIRRRFLLAHYDKFPEDRLVCLASCYVNVECYGNRYPGGVMQQLRHLSLDLPKDDEDKIIEANYRKRNLVKFVKSSTQTGAAPPSDKVCSIFDTPEPAEPVSETVSSKGNPPGQTKRKQMTFVKSGESFSSTDLTQSPGTSSQNPVSKRMKDNKGSNFKDSIKQYQSSVVSEQDSDLLRSFYIMSGHVRDLSAKRKNILEVINQAADKSHLVFDSQIEKETGGFVCKLKIGFVFVGDGHGSNKKNAKTDAYEKAIDLLRKPYQKLCHPHGDGEPSLESSDFPFEDKNSADLSAESDVTKPMSKMTFESSSFTKLGQTTKSNIHAFAKATGNTPHIKPKQKQYGGQNTLRDFSSFLIVEPQHVHSNATSILNQSAAINHIPVDFDFTESGSLVHCEVVLGGNSLCKMSDSNRIAAKATACHNGLEYLRTICWTIQTKKNEDTDDSGITRDGLLGEISADLDQSGKICDSNIGSQLLKKMGWKGGGLGRAGQGISEPVTAGNVIHREGLGLRADQGIGRDFLPKISQAIQSYITSDKQEDMVFSPMFSKDERALIHKEAQKLGLKTHSHGAGEERYLVLSRKRTVKQLFSHVAQSGGQTSKYILLPPGGHVKKC